MSLATGSRQAATPAFSHPGSSVPQHATFGFPAGDYSASTPAVPGCPAGPQADRPIENTGVVFWYTLGSHHIARPKDWPAMPVERVGFALEPSGFFDHHPALDVAPNPSPLC
jgi:primary-amine oxidase